METRTTTPKNNKYYMRTASGGYNGAVKGSPTVATADVLCNCVGYANGRFNEIIGKGKCVYQLVCNAENFIESAKKQGLSISSTPVQGGIMVWQKGSTLKGSDGAGHVAVVEEIYSDGSILTSESGWASWAFKTIRRYNANGRWGQGTAYKFRGCIINPAVTDAKVIPAPKLTVDGIGGAATVRALQYFLGTPQDGEISGQYSAHKKYRPSLKAVKCGKGGSVCVKYLQKWLSIKQDGIWGKATSTALQKKLGVTADGAFGEKSMKALQKLLNASDKATYPVVVKKTATTAAASTAAVTAASVATTTTGGAAKIVANVKAYCWPYGTASKKWKYKTGSAKAAYKTALKKYLKKSAKISRTDCGYFVSTCVRAAGLGKSFLALPGSAKKSYPKVPSTMKIVLKGKKVPNGFLQPGDIIRYRKTNGHQHTFIYYGDGKIAEAGRKNWFPRIVKDTKKYNRSNVKRSSCQVIRAK